MHFRWTFRAMFERLRLYYYVFERFLNERSEKAPTTHEAPKSHSDYDRSQSISKLSRLILQTIVARILNNSICFRALWEGALWEGPNKSWGPERCLGSKRSQSIAKLFRGLRMSWVLLRALIQRELEHIYKHTGFDRNRLTTVRCRFRKRRSARNTWRYFEVV